MTRSASSAPYAELPGRETAPTSLKTPLCVETLWYVARAICPRCSRGEPTRTFLHGEYGHPVEGQNYMLACYASEIHRMLDAQTKLGNHLKTTPHSPNRVVVTERTRSRT